MTDNNFTGVVTDIYDDYFILSSKENLIVYTNTSVKIGQRVNVNGTLKEIDNITIPNLYSYKNYLLSKNIHYKLYAENAIISEYNNVFYKIKNYLINIISGKKHNDYLYAFILGDNKYIKKNILNSYRTNGISHLFSISGMHIGLLSSIILYILNLIKKSNINYILVIIFLIFYMFLTNFTPSVIRATFLFIFIYINKILKLNLSTIKILIYILIYVLIKNPYNVYNTGFIFSYVITFYLILFNSIISNSKNYISKLFLISFISYLVSIPILINNYFSINLFSIINNIIFVPLISIVIFPVSILTIFIPKLDIIFNLLIIFLENLSLILVKFKIELILCHINFFVVIFYYIIITFILYQIKYKNYKYFLLIVIIIFIHSNKDYIFKNSYITFIDVGQGDSTFIHNYDNKKNILIDTGGNYNYELSKNIINYLKSKGIKIIHYLILTHGDYDHMGEAINLVNNFKVENVIFNNDDYNELESELIKVLDKKNIKYYKGLKELNIGNDKLYFLNNKEYDNENDNSNVLYFKLNNYKFLFMGDAGIEREKDILDKYNLSDIDFIKIGHHGSNTSSSKEFIDSIKPKNCLISVGKNNRYGHPKDSVINILDDYCNIYRTDINGSVEIRLNKNNYKIKTYSP